MKTNRKKNKSQKLQAIINISKPGTFVFTFIGPQNSYVCFSRLKNAREY